MVTLSPATGTLRLGQVDASDHFVAFPDDDCWYEAQTLERAAQALDLHPDWDGLVGNWPELLAAVPTAAGPGPTLGLADWRRFKGGDASSITIFMRLSLLREVGAFDENLGVGSWYGAGEETDLVLRALARRHVIGRAAAVCVHHRYDLRSQSYGHAPWRELMLRGRGTGALYVKHRLSPWVALRDIIRVMPANIAFLKLEMIVGLALRFNSASAASTTWAGLWTMACGTSPGLPPARS